MATPCGTSVSSGRPSSPTPGTCARTRPTVPSARIVQRSGAGLASPLVVIASHPGATGGPDCTLTTRWVSVRPRRRGCAKVITTPGRPAAARCGLTTMRSPGEYAGRIDPVTMVSGRQSARRNAP